MDSPLPRLWPLLRTPARILLSGAAALMVLAGARLLGLPPLAALLSSPGAPAQFAAFLIFGVGIAFAAFLWWLAARSFAFLRDPRTTPEQLASLRELPLALPEGTVRALLALIVGVVGLPLLLFSQALALNDAVAGYVNGIIAGVFGYYFGARSTAAEATTTRRLGEALAGQGRQAEALREENAALRERAAEAAAAGARPGQLAAALDALSRQIAVAANLLETLGPALPPGLVPAGAADALKRARAVAAEARALATGGEAADPGALLGRVLDATAALAGRDGAFAVLLRAAAGALPAAVAGGPLAGVSLLLGLGWQAGSAAWRRWRAQVLAAPHDPTLFDPGSVSPSSAALRLEDAPVFAAAFAALRDRPGFAADLLDLALRDDAPARLWAEHGERFASPEAAATGLAEFRRALLVETADADVSAPALDAVAAGLAAAAPALRPEGATPEAARALLLATTGAGAPEARAALHALATLVGLLREQKVDALRAMAELAP
jgi:hypothetical protein